MPITKQQKAEMLKELQDMFKEGKSVFFSDYRGIPVNSIQKIRRQLREKNVQYKVAKKTLVRIAAKDIGYDDIPEEVMEGPVAIVVSMDDALAGAKVIQTMTKEYPQLRLLGGLFDQKILNAKEAKEYALLPSKEELLAKLVFLLKSPIQGFHGVLSNVLSGFVRTTDAYREKREKEAPAAAAPMEASAPAEAAPAEPTAS